MSEKFDRPFFIRIGLFLFMFFLVGQVIALTNRSGITWSLFRPVLADNPNYQLAHALFDIKNADKPFDLIAVGDRTFLSKLNLPTNAQNKIKTVTLPTFNLKAITLFLKLLPRDTANIIVLQSAPFMFSDIKFPGAGQRTELYRQADTGKMTLWPKRDVKVMFASIRDIVRTKSKWKKAKPYRLKNFDELSFNASRKELQKLIKALGRHRQNRIIWGLDYEGYDVSSNRQLFSAFSDYVKDENIRNDYGVFYSMDALRRAAFGGR